MEMSDRIALFPENDIVEQKPENGKVSNEIDNNFLLISIEISVCHKLIIFFYMLLIGCYCHCLLTFLGFIFVIKMKSMQWTLYFHYLC